MYRDVSKKAYTQNDLKRTYRDSDLPRFSLKKSDFELVAENTANFFASNKGFIKNLVVSPRPKQKHLFTLPNIEDHLLVRRSHVIISKFLGVQAFSRDSEVRQLISLIKTEPKARIIRTDIKSFFESLNLEHTLDDLVSAGFNNVSTIKHLREFARKGKEHSTLGLLRGISLSSLLADFAMRDFDRKVKLLPSCCYYCRYVDDILVVTTNESLNVFEELQKALPPGLKLNPRKTENRRIGANERIEFLGYSIDLNDFTSIRIATAKINKAKKRIALSIQQFLVDRDFSILCDRIQFLTTNTIMTMYSRTKPLVVGYRYSYCIAKETEVINQMRELDSFLFGFINSKSYHLAKRLNKALSPGQKKSLMRYSFLKGYSLRITVARSSFQIAKIKQAWKYAKK